MSSSTGTVIIRYIKKNAILGLSKRAFQTAEEYIERTEPIILGEVRQGTDELKHTLRNHTYVRNYLSRNSPEQET